MTPRKPKLADEVARRMWPAADPHFDDPVGWIVGRLGAIWSGQERIARALAEHRRVAVASAHGCGKDWIAAALIGWWISTRADAFAVTSAPTSAQLSGILWRELARHHRAANLGGTITTGQIPTWRIGGELRGWGRKPADLSDPEAAASAFSGIHARHVLTVLDEASGLDDWLWQAADTLMTSEDSRLLAIGNPLDPSSRFARVCAPGSGWHVIHLSVFDTPAFTGEEVSPDLLAVLPSELWVQERERDWGVGSPTWIARVLGQFPPASADTLIQPAWLQGAQARDLTAEGDPRLGCDIARSGSDRTVVAACWPSGRLRIVHDEHGSDTMETVGAIQRLLREDFGPPDSHEVVAAIDIVGLGAGVHDRLREQGANVSAYSSAARAIEHRRFANLRAESFWRLREALEAGEVDLDRLDEELAAQLGSLRWKTDSAGRILIESKDSLRSRGLPSPDRADAAAMALDRRTSKLSEQAKALAEARRTQKPSRVVASERLLADEARGQTTEEAWASPRRSWKARLDDDLPEFR